MKAEVTIADQYLIWLDNHCAYRAMQGDSHKGLKDVEAQDVINAMVLGAFKSAGFGRKRCSKKRLSDGSSAI